MSAEMTLSEQTVVNEQPQETPVQAQPQENKPKQTWICGNPECHAVIDWIPFSVRHLHPSKIRCLKCQKAKAANNPSQNGSKPEAPKQPQRKTPSSPLTLETVELHAYRTGIPRPQVEALLSSLREAISH